MTGPETPVALVTGAARGIGRVIAADLARDHRVAITWNTTAPGTTPAESLAIQADLSEPQSAADVIAAIIDRFGRLDVLVNNAGAIAHSKVDQFDQDAYRAILDVNLLAPHGLLAAALAHLQPGAAVINISSVNAVLPPQGAALYGASKAALDLWTRAMAKELGPRGIRVNAVAPGAINIAEDPRPPDLTQAFVDMTALGRIGTPEDISKAVRFLASDQAEFITGEVLTVSGGYRL
ncbi:SDR family oxidoreductase [Aestuariivita sp.]|jgi:NAD(P)-dependent dehydrogenase (short-subunit alcohol dehydrogenase family)|uniref:SDR family NAD(P)-dependent oxidoreductase n=1 Tax=Aestuariivita sp. TaxID=1872407 RepID=UPI002171FFF7|nr:SDR family oxidoreductase [Aestuariivita sp.]MCE8008863.1 SDR family oxidoreductase [Aestuariivita sp.]